MENVGQEGRTIEDEIEITVGICFDRGFLCLYGREEPESQVRKTADSVEREAIAGDITSLKAATRARWPLVIIAEDIDGEALAACIFNKLVGGCRSWGLKPIELEMTVNLSSVIRQF